MWKPDSSEDFKRYAVHHIASRGYAVQEMSERLGVSSYSLYKWMKLYAGCDDDEIASYSGHMSKSMILKYAGEARQEMRAKRANEKRSRSERNETKS
ncbi:transposase [Litoreibacter arenae]|uniref:Mobile element protein n=1 Tax=Litoreibacter arenae DSM 19593 TaxID=1123360 RepID=S9QMJ4_9RHOB|nr:transposase [Litoreibacter arenae]EPX80813.1 Mobile element protein [Litoreibacter arenae DSM 19593]